MRLHRFYVNEQVGDRKQLTINSAELVHQVCRVFRLGIGEKIIIFDGSGFDYECTIDRIREKTIISTDKPQSIDLSISLNRQSAFSPGRIFSNEKNSGKSVSQEIGGDSARPEFVAKKTIPEITLYMAVVKKDTFEWIVQKATELGVSRIVPILAERSEKKSLNQERLVKIAIEASEQCGRGNVPVIEEIQTLSQVIGSAGEGRTFIVFHTEGEYFKPTDISNIESVGVFIGPEGGWSPAELEMFHKNSLPVRCLGPQVLRAETAAVAALSVVVFG
jgi:16S rRNA (uracil1498-N3)-methyltransferase